MKILFILDLYKPNVGGLETLFENIISRLEKKGNKIIILTSKYCIEVNKYEKVSKNIEIYRVGNNRYDFMFFSIFKGVKLAKICDIIHTTTYNSAIPSWFIGKLSGKKVVLTVHEIFGKLWYKFMGWKGFFFKSFEDLIFKFNFDKYICVSNYTKNSLRISYLIDDKKLITIYNGIDYKKWNKDNYRQEDINKISKKYNLDNHFIGLYFGRPGISKGLEFYIRSIPKILKKIKNFKAMLIVPSNEKKRVLYIKLLINDLGIEKNIIWIPGVFNDELGNYILASNFVIVPSLAEGFGFAAVEVCSLGQKLLVSEVASLPDVVSGKINFIEPGSVEDIEKGVIKFFNNQYKEINDKNFTWENNIENTLEVYNNLLWKND